MDDKVIKPNPQSLAMKVPKKGGKLGLPKNNSEWSPWFELLPPTTHILLFISTALKIQSQTSCFEFLNG